MSKRIQLKVDDSTYELLQDLATKTGISTSSLVTLMIESERQRLEAVLGDLKGLGMVPARIFDALIRTLQENYRLDSNLAKLPRRGKGTLKE